MKKFFALVAIIVIAALSLSADVYIKTKTHTDALSIMGQTQPAKDEINETWFADTKLAFITKEQSMVVDLAKNMIYLIYPNKTYIESTLPFDFAKILPDQMAAMAGMMKMTVSGVGPTGETKKVGKWNCQGYKATMSIMGMSMNMILWTTTDVPFDPAKYMKLYGNVFKSQMRLDEASIKEFDKIKGFQAASETSGEMMGAKIHTTSEVTEIAQKAAPAGVYSIPAGYTKRDKLTMEEASKR